MTADDPDGTDGADDEEISVRIVDDPEPGERDVDRRLTDLLGRLLDTETRAKVYVAVLREPETTAEAIARASGLYPETVRDTLTDLEREGVLEREEIAGDGRYGYVAIPPSDLAGRLVEELRSGLDSVFDDGADTEVDPVRIEVEDGHDRREDDEDDPR